MADIIIKKMIAHHMNLSLPTATCINQLIEINKPELTLIVNFFEKHIKNALNESRLKPCVFQNSSGTVLTHCSNLVTNLNDDQLFINSSIDLTNKLHGFMSSTSSKSSGALIFIIYENIDTNQDYLGILKMDPNEGIEFDPVNVAFTVRQHMLPDTREKLHKSAFIKLNTNISNEEYQLFVLDKQQRTDGISKFFLNSFLEAKEVFDHGKMTTLFEETVMDLASEESINIFSLKKDMDRVLVNGGQINVDNTLEDLFREYRSGEEDRKELIEKVKIKMRDKYADSYFEFEVQRSENSTYLMTNEDKSLRISFPDSMFETVVFVETGFENDEKVTTIKIKGEHINIKNKPK